MDLAAFLSQVLNLLGTFTSQLVILLFLVCLISEGLGFTVPYLLETVWLMTGYQVSRGATPVYDVVFLVLTAQAGRQIGSLVFFYLSQYTTAPLRRLSRIVRLKRFFNRSEGLMRKVNLLSPFSVALGRLLGLRVPITLILGANRKLRILAMGILLSSLAFDGTYIALGAIVGTTAVLNPIYIFFCFIISLVVMYGVTVVFHRSGRRMLERVSGADASSGPLNSLFIPPLIPGSEEPPTPPEAKSNAADPDSPAPRAPHQRS